MKRYYKITLVLTLMFVLIASLAVSAAANEFNPFEKAKQLQSSRNTSKVLLQTKDFEITQNDLDTAKLFRNDNLSDDQLLKVLTNNKLMLLEAKRLGLQATVQEAKDFAQKNRDEIQNLNNPTYNQEIADLCKSLGVSEDEYWNNEAIKAYTDLLTVGKLKAQIYNESTQNVEDSKKQDTYRKALDDKISTLRKSYNLDN